MTEAEITDFLAPLAETAQNSPAQVHIEDLAATGICHPNRIIGGEFDDVGVADGAPLLYELATC